MYYSATSNGHVAVRRASPGTHAAVTVMTRSKLRVQRDGSPRGRGHHGPAANGAARNPYQGRRPRHGHPHEPCAVRAADGRVAARTVQHSRPISQGGWSARCKNGMTGQKMEGLKPIVAGAPPSRFSSTETLRTLAPSGWSNAVCIISVVVSVKVAGMTPLVFKMS